MAKIRSLRMAVGAVAGACLLSLVTGCGSNAAALSQLRAHDWQLKELTMSGGRHVGFTAAPAVLFHWAEDGLLEVSKCPTAKTQVDHGSIDFDRDFAVDTTTCTIAIDDQSIRLYLEQTLLNGKATWRLTGDTLVIDHGGAGEVVLTGVAGSPS